MSLLAFYSTESNINVSFQIGSSRAIWSAFAPNYTTTLNTLSINSKSASYNTDVTTIVVNNGVFFGGSSVTILSINSGLYYDNYSLTAINSDKMCNYSGYTLTTINVNSRQSYVNYTQLFAFMQKYIYKQSNLRLAVNKMAATAAGITLTLHGYELSFDYYTMHSSFADKIVADISDIASIISDPDTVVLTLVGPIIRDDGILQNGLSDTQSLDSSPYSETDTAYPIEIRDSNDLLITTLDLNQVSGDYTTDNYTLWYGRYYHEDLRSPIFVRVKTAPTYFNVAVKNSAITLQLTTTPQQFTILEPDSSDTIVFELTSISDETFEESVDIEFYTMKGMLTSARTTSSGMSSQDVNMLYKPDYTFTISAEYGIIITLTELLTSIAGGVYENMHI